MQIDLTTYQDLSIFHPEEEYSIFHKLNLTRTAGGKEWMKRYFLEPLQTSEQIRNVQSILQRMMYILPEWPQQITNGTLLVLEKFLDYDIDTMPVNPGMVSSHSYRLFHSQDFSMSRFSLSHFQDFLAGLRKIIDRLSGNPESDRLSLLLERASHLMQHQEVQELCSRSRAKPFTTQETVYFGQFLHGRFRHQAMELIEVYCQLDAWYGMAAAVNRYGLTFPEVIDQEEPYFQAEGLYHLLLEKPVSYGMEMTPRSNFIFLTGANMAGKSTFIKSVGLSVFLAHIGMGVPAAFMKMSLFDGILSNINVSDNIAKGESYFFNEVQRIKNTVIRISDNKRWLILIDELFKGTNIQDAMKCSSTVIKGLIRIRRALFILSTHLYEIGEELKIHPNICFRFFETGIRDGQLEFSYQLREGISNDRIGYLILQREKVTDLLDHL